MTKIRHALAARAAKARHNNTPSGDGVKILTDCRLSFARTPVRREQATRHLTLEVISHTPTLPRDEVCDFSFGLPPTRLMHSVKNSAKDAPQNADLLHNRVALWRVVTNVRGQIF